MTKVNRNDFKRLAIVRIRDAQALLKTRRNASGAYYLAGYAVECALKACIARQTRAGDWPPKAQAVQKMYSHDLEELVAQAGLKKDRDRAESVSAAFAGNWGTVKEWSEQSRYEISAQSDAQALITAITDEKDGVLPWIQQYW